jgi:hypothetical protein
MTEEFFEHLRDLTYEDLWEETLLLEKSEASEERKIKINLLRTKAEFFQLINKLKRLKIETPEFMNQFDLVSFFNSDNLEENEKKITLLKSKLTKLTHSGQESKLQTHMENDQCLI